ncbi:phage gpG-like protein [Bradyrhizobium sp. GM5.1]
MAFQLQWTVEGEKQVSRVLIGMESSIKDLSYPLKESAGYLKRTFSVDVFNTQGGAIGERWKRLSPYTVAQKARRGYPLTPLVASGRMQNSFQTIVSSDQAVIYNTAPYFKFHQSKEPRTKIPRRIMMKLADNQKEQIVRFFQAHLQAAMHNP